MKTLTMYGQSDDLMEFDGLEGTDEFNPSNSHENIMGTFEVTSQSDWAGLKISVIYDGCWSFAIGLRDEETNFPNWPIRISRKHEYSMLVEIDVPDDAVFKRTE